MKFSRALAVLVFVPPAHAQGPAPFCTAGTATNGCAPSINANVQPNTANTAGCVITTSGVEGEKQGIVFYGVNNTGFTPAPWGAGSSSFRCVKPPTKRVGAPQNSGGAAGQCNGSFVINWDAFQAANPGALGNPWVAGDSVFVQSWYRDPLAVKTSNLSNALELTLRAETTKAGKSRSLPITRAMATELAELRRAPAERVFRSPDGHPLGVPTNNAMRVLNRLLAAANIERVDAHGRSLDLHALRHTAASRFARHGAPLAVTQRILGHSDPKLTARVYVHLGVEEMRGAVETAGDG